MDRPLYLTEIETKPVATEVYVNLNLLIPGNRISDGDPVKLALAHVIPYLKAGVLIGGDTLGYFGANLDFRRRVMAIHDCDFETPIKVLAKDHTRVKRVVTAKQQTIIPAHSVMAVPINIREKDRIPEDRDFSFLPEFKSPQLGQTEVFMPTYSIEIPTPSTYRTTPTGLTRSDARHVSAS
jgi:hypothetical protein